MIGEDCKRVHRLNPGVMPMSVDLQSERSRVPKFSDCFCPYFLPKRYVFIVLGFLATTLIMFLVTCLSLTIVAMVDRRNETISHVKTANECIAVSNEYQDLHVEQGEFDYSPQMEGVLLGSVFYSQMVMFGPAGRLSELCGAKRVLLFGMILASVATALTPIAARLSVYAFIVCRLLVGIGSSTVAPSVFWLIPAWIPLSERHLSSSLLLAGYGIGVFVSFFVSGVICASQLFGGWPAVFYIEGLCGLLWCVLCFFLVYETPKLHPTITLKELNFISRNLESSSHKRIKKVPWKSMLFSIPLWSLVIGYFGQFWILGCYFTTQALYMGTIIKVGSMANGVMSSVPHLTRVLLSCLCSFPLDWLVKKKLVSIGFVRKGVTILNSIVSCAGIAVILLVIKDHILRAHSAVYCSSIIVILLVGCDPMLNTIAFAVGILMGSFNSFGVCLAGVDIAPNLAGTVSGILNTVGSIPFFMAPALVGWLTRNERSMAQWSYFYYITIGVIVVTTVIYVVFGTSEPQSWGTIDEEPASVKANQTEDKKS